jgi:hypothetical protein
MAIKSGVVPSLGLACMIFWTVNAAVLAGSDQTTDPSGKEMLAAEIVTWVVAESPLHVAVTVKLPGATAVKTGGSLFES